MGVLRQPQVHLRGCPHRLFSLHGGHGHRGEDILASEQILINRDRRLAPDVPCAARAPSARLRHVSDLATVMVVSFVYSEQLSSELCLKME